MSDQVTRRWQESTDIPLVIGIGGYYCGHMHFDGERVRTFLLRCEETLNGYDDYWTHHGEQKPFPDPDFDAMNAGDEFGKDFKTIAPDAEGYVSGCNDTDEAGYCVFLYPGEVEVPNTITEERFRSMLLAWNAAPGNAHYLASELFQWDDPKDPTIVHEVEWIDNPDVKGWGYPERDQ